MNRSRHILESGQRLSQSMLWPILDDFYKRQGMDAWRNHTIPHYITCNPTIADAYAQIVLGYWQDCQAANLAPQRPYPILELGAGSGRFAFLFLRRLLEHMARDLRQPIPFVYVMSDFSPSTVAGWQQHPALAPFVAHGWLDFALFDPLHDRELRLLERREIWNADDFQAPGTVFANYFFDSLRQDLFGVENGRLYELLTTLVSSQPEPDLADPELLERIQLEYTPGAVADGYYGDADLDAVLAVYAGWRASPIVNFPIDALRCVQRMERLFGGNLMVISADRGFIREDLSLPEITVKPHNGAFSLPMNFHALATYTAQQGGEIWQPRQPHTSLCVAAFVMGDLPAGRWQTQRAFARVDEFGPDDFFQLSQALESYHDALTLDEIVALLRFGRGDPHLLQRCLPGLRRLVTTASATQKAALHCEIDRAWAAYYHVGDDENLPHALGDLLYQMGLYAKALIYYTQARTLYGDTLELLYNMAFCTAKADNPHAALPLLDAAEHFLPDLPALIQRHTRQRLGALRATIRGQISPELG